MQEETDPGAPPPYNAGPPEPQQSAFPPPQPVPYEAQPPIKGEWNQPPLPECGPGQGDALLQQPPLQSAPYAYYGQQNLAPQTTVVMQPLPIRLTPFPIVTQCSNCGNTVTTDTRKQIGGAVWLAAALTCFFGFFFALCCLGLIPFCISSLKDTVHTCPVCKHVLGKHAQL